MAVSVTFYNSYKLDLLDANIDHATGGDTIKVALVTSTYTQDIDAHDFFDDITNEIASSGYVAGGATLANQATSKDNTDDEGVFDADDVSWSALTATPRGAIIYKSTGTDSTSPLIAYVNFGQDEALTADDFSLTWDAEGIINVG